MCGVSAPLSPPLLTQETLCISGFSVAEAEHLTERTSGRKVLVWLCRGYSPSGGETRAGGSVKLFAHTTVEQVAELKLELEPGHNPSTACCLPYDTHFPH